MMLLDRVQVPLEQPEHVPIYKCSACGGGIHMGMEYVTDFHGRTYHLDKKCLAEGIQQNLPHDRSLLLEVFTEFCEGIVDVAW